GRFPRPDQTPDSATSIHLDDDFAYAIRVRSQHLERSGSLLEKHAMRDDFLWNAAGFKQLDGPVRVMIRALDGLNPEFFGHRGEEIDAHVVDAGYADENQLAAHSSHMNRTLDGLGSRRSIEDNIGAAAPRVVHHSLIKGFRR